MNSPASAAPEISVVLSAYNAAGSLARALDSLLGQEGVNLEIIAVNDGSKDATGDILDEYARRDPRVRPIHQENHGLTLALMRGCAEARGEFIARQDADDVSLPGRLSAQLARARGADQPVLVAVGCGCVTDECDLLYATTPPTDANEARQVILRDGRSICCHGALLFRRDIFESIGGYRPEFYFAQDIDLILRLAARGAVAGVTLRAYDYAFAPNAISGTQHDNQQRFLALARACQRARESSQSEEPWLKQARDLTATCRNAARARKNPAAGYYFMASCLMNSRPERARHYFQMAWKHRPFWPRAIFRVVQTLFVAKPPRSCES